MSLPPPFFLLATIVRTYLDVLRKGTLQWDSLSVSSFFLNFPMHWFAEAISVQLIPFAGLKPTLPSVHTQVLKLMANGQADGE